MQAEPVQAVKTYLLQRKNEAYRAFSHSELYLQFVGGAQDDP